MSTTSVLIVCKLCFFNIQFRYSSFVFNLFTDRNVDCLKLLLNNGAALNRKDNFGR